MKKIPRVEVVYDFKHEARIKGKGTVYIRVYYNGRRSYVSTGVKVSPGNWDDKYMVIGGVDAAFLNQNILKIKEAVGREAYQAVSNGGDIPYEEFKLCKSDAPFLDFVAKYIDESDFTPGTKKHHHTVLAEMERFGKIRRFSDVTPRNLKLFFSMVKCHKVKKVNEYGDVVEVSIDQQTVHNYYKKVHSWVKVAQDKCLVPLNAMAGVKVQRGTAGEREHLTQEEVERWSNTRLLSAHLAEARDRFIVQMGTGLSFSDLMETDFSRMEEVDGMHVISGRRIKTKKSFFIVVLPMAEKIIRKWKYKVPAISNQDYNRYLALVANYAGIEKHITSHVGRHTYACLCLSMGIRLEAVQRTLGHSSIKTTQIYARMMDRDVVSAFRSAMERGEAKATPQVPEINNNIK